MRLGVCVSYFFNIHSFIMSLLPFLSHRAPFSASPLSLEFSTTDVSVCLTYDVTCTGACTNPHAHSLARFHKQRKLSYHIHVFICASSVLLCTTFSIRLRLCVPNSEWRRLRGRRLNNFTLHIFRYLCLRCYFQVFVLRFRFYFNLLYDAVPSRALSLDQLQEKIMLSYKLCFVSVQGVVFC